MRFESLEIGLLSLITITSFFIFFLVSKFSNNFGNILDKDFNKPQSFHEEFVPRSGGIASIICFSLFLIFKYLLFDQIRIEYIFVCYGLFFVGLIEDLNISIKPLTRLISMIILIFLSLKISPLVIGNVDLQFLNLWLTNKIFMIIFIILCFLFIINGSNLIDGFNGLLGIHILIINFFLLLINKNELILQTIITAQIIILLVFLMFNFPKAKIFMGDSGSYFFGALTSINIILTHNTNPQISSFFFCILLYYVFFEVFFSFFRKLKLRKSPLKPDDQHLHMLVYKLIKKKYLNNYANPITSLFINLFYLATVLPSLFFMQNGLLCKLWFTISIIIYLISYKLLIKATNDESI